MFNGIGSLFVCLRREPEGFFVFLWTDTKFFFKSTEKVGVIFEAIGHGNFTQRFAGKDVVLAGIEPFLTDTDGQTFPYFP